MTVDVNVNPLPLFGACPIRVMTSLFLMMYYLVATLWYVHVATFIVAVFNFEKHGYEDNHNTWHRWHAGIFEILISYATSTTSITSNEDIIDEQLPVLPNLNTRKGKQRLQTNPKERLGFSMVRIIYNYPTNHGRENRVLLICVINQDSALRQEWTSIIF